MANTNRPLGFKILDPQNTTGVVRYRNVKSGDTFVPGDVVYIDSSGYQTSTSGKILGIAVSYVMDTNGEKAASGGASNNYMVDVDTRPDIQMVAQISSYAITDPYTTANAVSACFDIAGSSGAQYINASSSSTDDIRIMCLANEWDDGQLSEVGAYAKVRCMFNPKRHFRTSQA